MKLERTFMVPESETIARGRVIAFLEQCGYRSVATQHFITYRRGGTLGFASFSPNGWRVKASVDIATRLGQSQVTAILEIDTTLQWVTEKERAFWKSELDCLEAAATTGEVDTRITTKSAQSAGTQNVYGYMLIVGLALVFAIGARQLFSSQLAFWAGTVVGAAAGILIALRWMNIKFGGG